MSRGKRYKTEEIIQILREVEIHTGRGQTVEQSVRACGITLSGTLSASQP